MKKSNPVSIVRPANGARFNGDNQVELKQLLNALIAFKHGNFSVRLPADWTGLAGKVADTFNEVIAINQQMRRELDRISRVVGKEGRINQRISLGAVSEGWADSIGSINMLIGDLVHPTSEMARVIGAVAKGDLSKTMATEIEGHSLQGEFLRTAKTVNTMVNQLSAFASEVTRVAREVGTEGKLGGQAKVKGVAGTWKDLTENVNLMAGNLTAQVRNIATVTTAVANGKLTKKITVDVKGEFLELKDTINTMVDQLRSFASEVTRVAREVGSEGILGGQARVEGVSGTWKDLTDSVNFMARNLTGQVRNIAEVTTAVARGDLSKKITVDVKGEILELKNTVNTMVDQLSSFAAEVTSVAREVGTEGKLGGQAQVKGDLTRSIKVEALGEVAVLKDNINEMIRNLKDQTLKNSEQDWLKTNLAKFSRMLQGQRDLLTVGRMILSELAPVVSAQHAVFYILDSSKETSQLTLLASYAHKGQSALRSQLQLGECLVGQCALEKQKILLSNVPPDYIRIASGLGETAPHNIIVLPVVFEGQVKGVLELASLERFNPTHQAFLDQLT